MENMKIQKIRKAASVTATVLNVLKIVAIVTIALCIVSGTAAMLIKTDVPDNTVRIGNLVFLGGIGDPNSLAGRLLNIQNPKVAAGLDAYIVAAMAAVMLAIVIILRKTFLEIEKSDTPFRAEVLNRIRITGILITIVALSYSIGIGAMTGLVSWCVCCIFDYGIELQKSDDETL